MSEETIMQTLNLFYDKELLKKWKEVKEGKYYLCRSEKFFSESLFLYDGIWFHGIRKEGGDTEYSCKEIDLRLIFSFFLDPRTKLKNFSYEVLKKNIKDNYMDGCELYHDDGSKYPIVNDEIYYDNGKETQPLNCQQIGKFATSWACSYKDFMYEEIQSSS